MALLLRCGIDENCRLDWQDARAIIGDLGSDGINTVEWTIETLDAAFAKYPLLPEDSPALQVMAGLGLSVTGLDTVTDFAALVSGRDPLTGRALTPRDMFITWLALSIPFVAASALHGFADDAAELLADFRPLREAGFHGDKIGSFLRSSNQFMGVERASPELVEAISRKGRIIEFATEGSEELRYLNIIGAEANVGGETMTHILLRENPSKAAVLEEFLHGTQHKTGIIARLGTAGAETHVKDFMIRHRIFLGLSDEDVEILKALMDTGL